MVPQARYQVFVSSTFEDLREERQQATQAILEAGSFPSGMELFPASDDTQWELIKRVIEESDYYIVVVAGRYGSLGPSGLSYTEMEYDYAIEKGIPVLGFVRAAVEEVSFRDSEKSELGRTKLEAFRQKVMSRSCRRYATASELGMAVMKSLMTEVRIRPRMGWVRADQARSAEDLQRERKLAEALESAETRIRELEREIRDRAILQDILPKSDLAQGDDILEFKITFWDRDRKLISENIPVTWNELLMVIGPSIYGYTWAKVKRNGQMFETYPFQLNLEEHIRGKIIDRVQNRKINISASQMDACILQFKELGLLRFAETKEDDGYTFRGVTLTEEGERRLSLLNIKIR